MVVTLLLYLTLAIVIAIVGALPFGLVNLTVVNVSIKTDSGAALKIAHGAALVEIVFGLTALLAGGAVYSKIQNSELLNYLIVGFIALAGVFFLLKNKNADIKKNTTKGGLAIGAFLNLISIQVLLYWFVAISFLFTQIYVSINIFTITVFAVGIWIGKMGVLWLYAYLSKRVVSQSQLIARNINKIIGIILILSALIQLIKK